MPLLRRHANLLLTLTVVLAGAIVFRSQLLCWLGYPWLPPETWLQPPLEVPLAVEDHDANENGVPDALDFVAGARREAERRTRYDASYYAGGYPPEGRGACTDVVWRAFREAGYDLKEMVDEDIRRVPAAYGATGRHPDPNIDFRRVSNLVVFFRRHAGELTTTVKPGDRENLVEWQPGDIVVFGPPYEHIGIISDKRRADGVPLLIHNAGPHAREGDYLLRWPSKITHHFRYSGRKD
ncbi:MAG: DUF1287 domain-containing protein [Bacillota bacterium]